MLLIILYIHVQTLKYINCIINCCIVSFLYFRHMKFLIMYIHLQNLKYINILLTTILSHIYIYIYIYIPVLCYYISCIYTYTL